MKSKSLVISALLGVLSVIGGFLTFHAIHANAGRPAIVLGFVVVAAAVFVGMLWLFQVSRKEQNNKVFRACGIIWLASLLLTLVFLVFGLASAVSAKKISWVMTQLIG
jgi:cytochrome bd-type quinol oxidase subunit 2